MSSGIGRFLQENAKVKSAPVDTTFDRTNALMDDILGAGDTDAVRLKAVSTSSKLTNAEKSQRVLQLESRTGFDFGLIERNIEGIETRVWQEDFEPAKAARGPIVRGWLADNPHHLPAVQRDLTKLNYLERQFHAIKDQFHQGRDLIRMRVLAEKDFKGTLTRSEEAELEALEQEQSKAPSLDEYALDFGGALNALPGVGLAGFLAKVPAYTANQVPIQAQILGKGLEGASAGAVAGALAGAAAGPAAPGVAPITAGAGAGAGFFTGVAVEAAKMEGYLAYREFKRIKDENGNPLPDDVARAAAVASGVANGALEMLELGQLSKVIPGVRLFRRDAIKRALAVPTFRRAIADLTKASALSSVGEGATEWAQEMVPAAFGVLATAVADGSINRMTPGEYFRLVFSSEHLAAAGEAAYAGAAGGFGMAGGIGAVGVTFEARRVKEAQRARQFFEALGEATSDTEIASKLPDRLQEIVKRMKADGPIENVYVPVERWNEYWQSQNIDPAEMASAVIGSTEAYNQAVAQGSDIEIPTERYAATLAPTEHNKFFLDELRHSPEAMNGRESREAVKKAAEAQPEDAKDPTEVDVAEKEVTERLTDMLQATGVYTDEQAKTVVGTLMGQGFRSLAARPDVDNNELSDIFARIAILRTVEGISKKVRQLKDEARTPGGARRKVHNVTEEALLDELDNIDVKAERATKRAIYRNVTIEGTDRAEIVVPMATKQAGGGPSMQAKALHNLVQLQRVRDEVYNELIARGLTEEQINAKRQERAENRAMLESERDTQADTEAEEADLPEWAKELADVSFDPAEFEQSAWHGSPYAFDRFDLQKIGSGEGAQVYGWGLYFSGSKAIAEYYRNKLSDYSSHATFIVDGVELDPNSPEKHGASLITFNNAIDIRSSARRWLKEAADSSNLGMADTAQKAGLSTMEYWQRLHDFVHTHGKSDVKVKRGRVYEVEIPDDDTMLLWDVAYEDQPPKVKAAIDAIAKEAGMTVYGGMLAFESTAKPNGYNKGRELYNGVTVAAIHDGVPAGTEQMSREERASRLLAAHGVNGIKYKADQIARGGHEQSYNYVIFDDKLIEIKDFYQGQRTGDRLSVLHNIHPDSLMYADRMGGLAVPSLGVVPEGMSYSNMGTITLIGKHHLADPAEGVPVFDADVWSPTHPKPVYKKAPVKKRDALVRPLYPFAGLFEDRGALYEIEQALERADPATAIDKMLRSTAVMALYLKERYGVDAQPVMKAKQPRLGFVMNTDAMREYVAAGGTLEPDYDDTESRQKLTDAFNAAVKEYVALTHAEQPEDVRAIVAKSIASNWISVKDDAESLFGWGLQRLLTEAREQAGQSQVSHYDTLERLEGMLSKVEFKDWVEQKVMAIHGEPLLELGRKKVPYTLANIVEQMTRGPLQAAQQHMTFGEGKARAAIARRITSLDEMRNRAAYQIASEETINEKREEAKRLMEAWRDEVLPFFKYSGTWEALDSSMKAVAYWGTHGMSMRDLAIGLRRNDFENVPTDVLRRGQEAALALLEAPVPYFEAKPQRAVALNEFAGAVLPKSAATPELMAVFEKHGIEARVYDDSSEADDSGAPQQEMRNIAIVDLQEELQEKGETVLFQSAWHGSPHIFDEFSLEKVGTGEGHQAYGWGLYFAGKRSVAEYYREMLATVGYRFDALTPTESDDIGDYRLRGIVLEVNKYGSETPTAKARIRSAVDTFIDQARRELEADEALLKRGELQQPWLIEERVLFKSRQIAALQKLRDADVYSYQRPGRLYHVDLPEDDTYLLWDVPLTEQPAAVQEAIRKSGYGVLIGTLKYPSVAQARRLLEGPTAARLRAEDIGIRNTIDAGTNYLSWWQAREESYRDGRITEEEVEQARQQFRQWWVQSGKLFGSKMHDTMTGESFYEEMMRQRSVAERQAFNIGEMRKAASLFLREHGITGIKYLDGGSRSRGIGTYNYVVFDDRQISVREYFQSPAPNDMQWSEVPAPFKAYSALERAIGNAPFEKGTPQQWRAIAKGVTQNERTVTGIEEFLLEHEKALTKTLTKADLLRYAQAHRLLLGDVVRGEESPERTAAGAASEKATRDFVAAMQSFNYRRDQRDDVTIMLRASISYYWQQGIEGKAMRERIWTKLRSYATSRDPELRVTDALVDAAVAYTEAQVRLYDAEYHDNQAGLERTSYGDYTEPGGSNYRELFITLPATWNVPQIPVGAELPVGWSIEQREENDWVVYSANGAIYMVGNTRENVLQDTRHGLENPDDETMGDVEGFRSAHSIPFNTLVHIRVKDRIDKDSGTRFLFIEEIQSDWHQQGRKRGYRAGPLPPLPELNAESITNAWRLTVKETGEYVGTVDLSAAWSPQEAIAEFTRRRVIHDARVPDAPFKKTGEWVELALKRVLSEAIRGNYDAIAWTTGDQQNARYSLSTVAEALEYYPASQTLVAYPNGFEYGEAEEQTFNVPPERLAEYVGEEAAARLLAADLTDTHPNGGIEAIPFHRIRVDELEIGGDGMRAFYDKLVPNTLEKLLKKLKVEEKVETTKIEYPGDEPYTGNRAGEQPDYASVVSYGVEAEQQFTVVDNPVLWVTPQLRDAVEGGLPLYQGKGKKRGRIRISSLGNISIEMLEDADLSTFIHETGHFYTEVLQRLAPSSPSVAADLAVLRNWVRAEEGKPLTVDQHEQIARGFEAYIMEGKAPTPALQDAFSRMKAWMLLVYSSIKALKVNLTDEVRDVFDRLLATQEEIEKAKAGLPALFPAARDFMPEEEALAYERVVREAEQSATMRLEQKLLADVKREYTKAWKEARARIRAEVAEEVNADPVWRALSILQRGTLPDGTELPEGMSPVKLDRQDIIDKYGERQLVLLPKPYIYASDDGITVDAAAELFGFESGDAFLKALPQPGSETPRRRVERLTDERMQAEFGNRLLDGKAAEDALEAVHNEDRARLLQLELRYLAENKIGALKGMVRRISRRVPVVEAVRAEAESIINSRRHRDIKPQHYLVAERKAAKAALEALLRGDVQLAFDEKQRELLNHELYRAAVRAKERAEKARKYLMKHTEKDTRARIGKAGHEFLEQIDAILERFEFSPASLKSLDKRQSLLAFIKEHPEVDMPEEILNEAYRKNWQEMTVAELADVHESVVRLAHLARRWNKLLKAKAARSLSEAASMVNGSVVANSKGVKPKEIETRLPSVARNRFVQAWFASHRKFASLVRQMDGFIDGGPIWQLLVRPLNEAASEEAVENEMAAGWLADAFKAYNAEKRTMYRKQLIPGTSISMSKMGRLMVALNWGNEINRQRLMAGYGWSEKTVQSILDTLEDKDWDFVERIWDGINGYWPRLEALGKVLTGLKPVKVEASPFRTRTGREVRGGYFPIDYDDRQSQMAFEHRAERMAERVARGAAVRAATEKGMLQERVKGNVSAELRLDFGVIFEHVSEVIHTVTHTETLMDVSRILREPSVMATIKAHYGDLTFKEMTRLLDDVAAGNVPAVEGFEDKMAWLRTGSTIVGLGFNVTTSLLQPFGLANSMVRIGPKWVAKGIGRWLTDAGRMENTAAWIHERSPFMRMRHRTLMREVAEIRNDIGLSADGWVAQAIDEALARTGDKVTRQGIADSFFWMIGKTQMVADIPTWLGAYEKAMEEIGTSMERDAAEEEAIARADQAVKDSQGAGQVVDLARVQRGGPLLKLWTTFYSYFNVVYNQIAESKAQHAKLNPVEIGRLAVDFLLLVTVPAALTMLVKDVTGGDDEDDEAYWKRLAQAQLSYLLGTMVFVREASSFVTGYFGYSGPAGARIFGELGKFAAQARQGELDAAFWKSLNRSAGIFLHYPAVQVERFVTGLKALSSGDTSNPLALLFGHKEKK